MRKETRPPINTPLQWCAKRDWKPNRFNGLHHTDETDKTAETVSKDERAPEIINVDVNVRTPGVARALVFLVIFIAMHPGTQAADSMEALLQRGLFEEEGNHNLEAAKKHYQAAVLEYDRQHKLAGTAMLHLAQCFEKEGRTNEARLHYERVVRDFAGQPDLVRAARRALEPPAPLTLPAASLNETNLSTFGARLQDLEIQRLTKLLKESPDLINASFPKEPSLLHQAVERDQVMVAAFLLSRNANVNRTTAVGAITPLQIAVDRTNREMVQLLLKNGAGVVVSSSRAQPPLPRAVETGNREIVQMLIDKGADPDAPGLDQVRPLETAARKGFLAIAELLVQHGADVNVKNRQNVTPLHAAASSGYTALTEFLMAKGANMEARDSLGATPLLAAARTHQSATMELLLRNGANINAATDDLFTATHLCLAGGGSDAALKALLHYKPELDVFNEAGASPLWLAVFSKLPGAFKLLVQAGANPDQRAPVSVPLPGGRSKEPDSFFKACATDGTTPLLIAIERGQTNEARALLESGANPNLRTISGRLPLSTAVETVSLPMAALLIEYRAHINGAPAGGQTALDLAVTMLAGEAGPLAHSTSKKIEMAKIIEILKTHGAVEHQPRPGAVCTVRGTEPYRSAFVTGSTNDPNRYTVLEAVLQVANTLAYPDLAKVKIRHPRRDNTQPPEFNAAAVLAQRAPKLDILVEWGDVIEIPEAAHPIGAPPGPPPDYSALKGISRSTNTDRNIYLIESQQRALEDIRIEIQNFQKSNNVANIKEAGLAAEERLQGLKNRLQSIQTQRKILQGKTSEEIAASGLQEFRAVQLLARSEPLSKYGDNSYAQFKHNLAKALAEKKALEETLLPMPPAMRTVIKQIRDLESAVNTQLDLIEKRRLAQIDALLKEEESMAPIIEDVRKEVMTSAHIRDEYTSLKEKENGILTQLERLYKERASNPAPPDKSVDTSAAGYGYPDEIALGFFACLRREVEIRMSGSTERLVLSPAGAPVLTGSPNRWLFDNFEPRLTNALKISKLPLSAGDFRNIRVTRQLPGESKPAIIECNLADNPTGPDNLWLRDGDIVDIRTK